MGEKAQEKAEDFKPKIKFRNFSSPVNKIIRDSAEDGLPQAIKKELHDTGKLLLELSMCRCKESCPSSSTLNALVKTINILKKEFDKSIGHRAYSTFELNIHKILINILRKNPDDIVITYPCLQALLSLSQDIPEILDADVMFLIVFHLDYEYIAATKQQFLKWIYALTVHNEENRQFAFEHLLQPLLQIFQDATTTSPVVEDVALAIRALVGYDDDPWTLLTACDRIRTIGIDVLPHLVYLLHKFLISAAVLKVLLVTIQKILIDNVLIEVLIQTDNGHGLLHVNNVFAYQLANEELILEGLKLYNILVDSAKVLYLMDRELLHIIKAVLRYYPKSENITDITLGLTAKILLKYPYCSKWYYEYYIPELIVRAMVWHPGSHKIQKKGSWIIRIFIKDCRIAPLFTRLNVSQLLMEAIERHKGKVKFDALAAMRDLGHKVDLTQPIRERKNRLDVPV